MRGELELLHHEVRQPGNERWVVALATVVRDAGGPITAERAVAEMLRRCRPDNDLFADFERASGLGSKPELRTMLHLVLGAVRRGLVEVDDDALQAALRSRRSGTLSRLILRPVPQEHDHVQE